MKDIIKILIVFIFLLMSYFVGEFMAEERTDKLLRDYEKALIVERSRTKMLQDSIGRLNVQLEMLTLQRSDVHKQKLRTPSKVIDNSK